MKYGFKPYDAINRMPSKIGIEKVNYNNDVLADLKTIDIDIISIAKNAIQKEKLKGVDIVKIKDLMIKYPYIGPFVYKLSLEFDKYSHFRPHVDEKVTLERVYLNRMSFKETHEVQICSLYCCIINHILEVLFKEQVGKVPILYDFYDKPLYLTI